MPPRKAASTAAPTNSKRKPVKTPAAKKPVPKRPPNQVPTRPPPTSTTQPTRARSNNTRRRSQYSMGMYYSTSDLTPEYIATLASSLTGDSLNSWGTTSKDPIEAPLRKRQRTNVRPGKFATFSSQEEDFASMMEFAKSQADAKEAARKGVKISNSPERGPILRLSLEVREIIYEYLLISRGLIVLKEDWLTVEQILGGLEVNILFTCKQFAEEGTKFMYANNTFFALIRPVNPRFRMRFNPFSKPQLPLFSHSLLRTLILDCSAECFNTRWFSKAAAGLQALANAKPAPNIHTLTLLFAPQRIGFTTTMMGREANPITFADWLWDEGGFMNSVLALAPTVLKVIVKMKGMKYEIRVEMKYLRGNEKVHLIFGRMINEETKKIAAENARKVEREIKELKGRFESVFEDPERALREGKCILLAGNVMPGGPTLLSQEFQTGGSVSSTQRMPLQASNSVSSTRGMPSQASSSGSRTDGVNSSVHGEPLQVRSLIAAQSEGPKTTKEPMPSDRSVLQNKETFLNSNLQTNDMLGNGGEGMRGNGKG